MDLLRWAFSGALTVFFATIAVLNRSYVDLFWSPIHPSLSLPLYIVILIPAAIGFIFGVVLTWINMDSLRKTKREQKKEITTLEQKIENLGCAAKRAKPPAKEMFSMLLPKLK